MKFRKKPIVVEAELFELGKAIPGVEEVEIDEVSRSGGSLFTSPRRVGRFTTIHGQVTIISPGTWVIREPDGVHWYPCDPTIFKATYDPVE